MTAGGSFSGATFQPWPWMRWIGFEDTSIDKLKYLLLILIE
jgi:hypothetical protein